MAESIVPSGYFGNGSENIKIFENFVSHEICDNIYEYCKNPLTWTKTRKEKDLFWTNKIISWDVIKLELFSEDVINVHDRIKLFIENTYNVKTKSSLFATMIVKWNPGEEQGVHGDRENEDGTPQHNEAVRHYDLSSILYINDNYEGGEIYLPQHNLTIKPKKGMLVTFPGDRYYIHGVSKITSGTRFTMPYWWAVDQIV
jgi:predicted 2-oxoglutarate/Fe(II)-dependent dioxygenase YbiX